MVREMESARTLNEYGHTSAIGWPATDISPQRRLRKSRSKCINPVPIRTLVGTVRNAPHTFRAHSNTNYASFASTIFWCENETYFSVFVHIPSLFSTITSTFLCSLLVNYVTNVCGVHGHLNFKSCFVKKCDPFQDRNSAKEICSKPIKHHTMTRCVKVYIQPHYCLISDARASRVISFKP